MLLGFQHSCLDESLTEPFANWMKSEPQIDEDVKNDIWAYLYLVDPQSYYEVAKLPVALEYYNEYQDVKKDPTKGIDKAEYENLLKEICTDPGTHQTSEQCLLENSYGALEFEETPENIKPYLTKWFGNFIGRKLKLPLALSNEDISLYELVASGEDAKDSSPRFIAVALLSLIHI